MNIGIDISQIVYEGSGVARFTNGLINAILEYDKNNVWHFFFSGFRRNLNRDLEAKITHSHHRLIKWKLPPAFLSYLWNDIHSSFISQFLNFSISLDYFISSDWTEPLLNNIKKATIVHDLVYLRYPETVDKKILETQKKRLKWVKKESKIIFADSQATKNDLIKFLQVQPNRILVNYPGVNIFHAVAVKMYETLKKYGLEKRKFILTVGKLEPRKNFNRLLEAFQGLRNEKLQLIVVGPAGWQQCNNITIEQYHNVRFLGYVPDSELYALYSSCLFFILPSIWEGFGYPIIEAMKCGAPVACSNTSSVKEIAQDAALLFNPLKTSEIFQSIDRLIRDGKLRKELAKKGFERSKQFTWQSYYNKLISCLESSCLGKGKYSKELNS